MDLQTNLENSETSNGRKKATEGSTSVLLVDDENSFLELESRFLSEIDDSIEVKKTVDPTKVKEILEEENIDCILSDYNMPEMNGIELLKTVREDYPNLPYILVTSKGSEEIASKAISAGVTDYIQKNSSQETFELLAKRVENAVEREEVRKDQRKKEERVRELFEITSDSGLSFEEKLEKVFQLGCEVFDMDIGGIAYIDPKTDFFEVEYISDEHENLKTGKSFSLTETYCKVLNEESVGVVTDPEELREIKAYQEFGVKSYIGKKIKPELGRERSFWFISDEPREKQFNRAEKAFHDIMANWAKQELEHREREKRLEEFNDLVTHDLRNPLNSAKGYLELAKSSENKNDLTKASQALERAENILGEIKAFPTEPEDLKKEEVNLASCFRDVKERMNPKIDVKVEEKKIKASKSNLQRVFAKLLENSLEHNEEDVKVEVGSLENGFYYSDNGKGIDDKRKGKILEKGVAATDNSGLGLYIVKRVAEAHGWKIEVTDSTKGGARFNFYTN